MPKTMNTLATLSLILDVISLGVFLYGGQTGIWNDPNIFYTDTNLSTGKIVITKGCRPVRLQPDGRCDRSFRLSEFLK